MFVGTVNDTQSSKVLSIGDEKIINNDNAKYLGLPLNAFVGFV